MRLKEIRKAAKEHAKWVLGEEEFNKNKSAVEAISSDFRAGVQWASEQKANELTKQSNLQ